MNKEYPSLLNLKCVTDEPLYEKSRAQEFRDMLVRLRTARLKAKQEELIDTPVHIPFDIVGHLGSRTIPITLDSMQSAKVNAEHYKDLFSKSQDYVQRVEHDSDDGITFWGAPQYIGGKSAFLANEILRRGLSISYLTMNPNPSNAYRDFLCNTPNLCANIWDEVPQKLIDSAGFLNRAITNTRQLSELSLSIKTSCNIPTDDSLETPVVLDVRESRIIYDSWGGGGGGSHIIEFKHRRGVPIKGNIEQRLAYEWLKSNTTRKK